jgi:hypothetical protein
LNETKALVSGNPNPQPAQECLSSEDLDKGIHSCRNLSEKEEANHGPLMASMAARSPTHGSHEKLQKWLPSKWSRWWRKEYEATTKANKKLWSKRKQSILFLARLQWKVTNMALLLKVALTVPEFYELTQEEQSSILLELSPNRWGWEDCVPKSLSVENKAGCHMMLIPFIGGTKDGNAISHSN